MTTAHIKDDVCIIGGGLAGIVTALEILENNKSISVTILDRDGEENFGGLALTAFGGMALVGTPAQKKLKIDDSVDRCMADWASFADFNDDDHWPRAWAKYYIENSNEKVYHWLTERDISFLPSLLWVERGLHDRGNTAARYHVLWGTSQFMTKTLIARLHRFQSEGRLEFRFSHSVDNLLILNGKVAGCEGTRTNDNAAFNFQAGVTVIATGGVGGNFDKVRENWPADWTAKGSPAPDFMLNGCHPYGDGRMHDEVTKQGGKVTHLDKMWNYAAGIPHPKPRFDGHGLSLIPTRTSMWANHKGERINKDGDKGHPPLITGFDTNYLCQQVAAQEKPWTWHIMNWKIASKELAISGAEHNPYIRDKRLLTFAFSMLTARPWLIKQMAAESDDVLVADTVNELVNQMNARTDQPYVDASKLEKEITEYDAILAAAPETLDDPQMQCIQKLREWTGDKIRTTNFKPILNKKSGPLVAIKTNLISRKTLGGIQTNLQSQVLRADGSIMDGLYAVGEAAGFGGGGASGKRSLEGTFLPGCIMTAQNAAKGIVG